MARAELTGSYSVASAAKESLKVWLQLSQVRHMYSTVKSSLHMQDYLKHAASSVSNDKAGRTAAETRSDHPQGGHPSSSSLALSSYPRGAVMTPNDQ